jgi:hypothetical protein
MLLSEPCKIFTICHALLTFPNIIIKSSTTTPQITVPKPISHKSNTPTLHIYASITLSTFHYSYWSQPATVQSTVQANPSSDPQMKICDRGGKKTPTLWQLRNTECSHMFTYHLIIPLKNILLQHWFLVSASLCTKYRETIGIPSLLNLLAPAFDI